MVAWPSEIGDRLQQIYWNPNDGSTINEFIGMWTPDIYRPRPEPFRARSMGLWLVGCRPVLQGWLFQQPRPERHLHVRAPAHSMTRPRSLRDYLLMKSFVVYASYCPGLPIL